MITQIQQRKIDMLVNVPGVFESEVIPSTYGKHVFVCTKIKSNPAYKGYRSLQFAVGPRGRVEKLNDRYV